MSSLFNVCHTFNNSVFICLRLNYILVSDVLLQTVKTYQPRNLYYILLKEYPHGFTLACKKILGINHISICYTECGRLIPYDYDPVLGLVLLLERFFRYVLENSWVNHWVLWMYLRMLHKFFYFMDHQLNRLLSFELYHLLDQNKVNHWDQF